MKKIPNVHVTILVCLKNIGDATLLLQRPLQAKDHLHVKITICIFKRPNHNIFVDVSFLENEVVQSGVRALTNKKYCFPRPEREEKNTIDK